MAVLVLTQTGHRPHSGRTTGVLPPLHRSCPLHSGEEASPSDYFRGSKRSVPRPGSYTNTHPRQAPSNRAEASIPALCPSAMSHPAPESTREAHVHPIQLRASSGALFMYEMQLC